MRIVTDPLALQQEALARRAEGQRIGFVPTMGYLHAGHTSLMAQARPQCDWLVVSIFVNPLQFGPGEDLDRYPRDPEGDAEKCRKEGVDVLFMPAALYPIGHSTRVSVQGLSDGLCGGKRPGHFDGVTTVVGRLFGLVQPHVAVFGEKDFQQLAVIRRMVTDLAMPIDVQGAPLVRDADGLALSSRNRYLSPAQRRRALSLSATLRFIRDEVQSNGGTVTVEALLERAVQRLDVDKLDYLDIRNPDTLAPLSTITDAAHGFVAAWVGQTRLIDNLKLV